MDMASTDASALPAAVLPPAQPTYVLRGHAVPIHNLLFLNENTWLISGDAEGYVVIWTLTTKRPVAVWQAHQGSILGLGLWGYSTLITHGRDGTLRVWNIHDVGEPDAGFSDKLPIEKLAEERKHPWLLHALAISTLNFCAFAGLENAAEAATPDGASSFLVAVPGEKDSNVEVYQLPSEKQVAMIPAPAQSSGRAGMVMALGMCRTGSSSESIHIACGYENGRACLYKQTIQAGKWIMIYDAQPHTQPILSLQVAPAAGAFFTSGADAVVAKHPLYHADGTIKEAQTKHSGQQGISIRSDGRILATAGWDSRIRVYSSKTLKELAVLKWHKQGCYAVDFAWLTFATDSDPGNTVAEKRKARVRATHWLAAGAKDGKISLWDIY